MRPDKHPKGELTARTCEMYSAAIACGEAPGDVVGELATMYGVQRPAIWRRLRAGRLLPPYGSGRRIGNPRRKSPTEADDARSAMPRVDRDPCPRCGVRHDVGCNHSRAPLGMVL